MNEQAEIEDRIAWVHRAALCMLLLPIVAVVLFAYGIAWLFTPDCEDCP